MRNLFLLTLLILSGIGSFGQKTVNDPELENKLFKPYDNFFELQREWVYTHVNKSAYIQGDDIWFTAYVLNPVDKRLNFGTTKLYVELWSPAKKLINRSILFVNAGTAHHYIHLDESLEPGNYCFRAYTSWMRNFYSESDLNTYITVLGHEKVAEDQVNAKQKKSPEKLGMPKDIQFIQEKRPDYDVQFLPEGGTFLEGVENVLGIKAADPEGKGIKITGSLYDSNNQEINTFITDDHGTTNIIIPATTVQKYTAKVMLPDSTTREIILPAVEPKGVNIHVNPYLSEVVWFRVQTNEMTQQLRKSYVVMIHANGVLYSSYRIMFSKENAIQFKVNKKGSGGRNYLCHSL